MKEAIRALCIGLVITGAIFSPGVSAKPSRCRGFKPGLAAAQGAKLISVTDKATEAKPLEISFEHPQALPLPAPAPITEDHVYYNIQIATTEPSIGLFILEEFNEQNDVDLYLYDQYGQEAASSTAFNPAPVGPFAAPTATGTSESVPGIHVDRCAGFTIESRATFSPQGTPATISIFLQEHQA